MDLLENSGLLSTEAKRQLNALNDEFDSQETIDFQAFEDLTAKTQAILARDGNIPFNELSHMAKIFLAKVGLRDGWKGALQALTSRGVPTYLFSSGYGDLVTSILYAAGLTQGLASMPPLSMMQIPSALPPNLRIISNFFRAAPDGSVRAFSQPLVHER
jgi:hypothetical protein